MKKGHLIFVFFLLFQSASGQNSQIKNAENSSYVPPSKSQVKMLEDSLKNGTGKQNRKECAPVPRVATKLAIIPGLGQLYNRDYWKLPFVYLSIGGGLYSYHLNNLRYKDYLVAYKSFYDLEKGSATYGALKSGITSDSRQMVNVRNLFNTASDSVSLTRDRIEQGKNYWRRNRNLSIIVTGLIHSLSIIEANVAAHLKTFDISDDLTLRFEPKISQPLMRQPAPGLQLVFNFK